MHWTTPNGPWFHKMSIQLIHSDMFFFCDWSDLWFRRRNRFLQVILHGIGAKASLKAVRRVFFGWPEFWPELLTRKKAAQLRGWSLSWRIFQSRVGCVFSPHFVLIVYCFSIFEKIMGRLCSAPSYLFRCFCQVFFGFDSLINIYILAVAMMCRELIHSHNLDIYVTKTNIYDLRRPHYHIVFFDERTSTPTFNRFPPVRCLWWATQQRGNNWRVWWKHLSLFS